MLDNVVTQHNVEGPPAVDDAFRSDVLDCEFTGHVMIGELEAGQVDEGRVDVYAHDPARSGLLRRDQEPAASTSDVEASPTGEGFDPTIAATA